MIKQKNRKIFLILVSMSILTLCVIIVSATRLPTVDGDSGVWGTILNDYLSKIAGSDATILNQTMVNGTNIYDSSINTTHLVDGTITDADISDTTNLTVANLSVSGNISSDNADFSGGWLNNGVSIINGGIYAQVGYFYNITSLNVTRQNLTIIDDFYALGKVGIGTTSPAQLLSVGDDSFTAPNPQANPLPDIIQDNTYDNSSIPSVNKWVMYNLVDSWVGGIGMSTSDLDFFVGPSANFRFHTGTTNLNGTGASEIFTILDSGNVGIGTVSPSAKLEVNDVNKVDLTLYSDANLNIFTTDNQATGVGGTLSLGGDRSTTGDLIGFGAIRGAKANSGDTDVDGELIFYTTKNAVGSVEQMRIDEDGNVGIGTTSPGKLLSLKASGTSAAFVIETDEGGSFLIDALGTQANPNWRINVNSGENLTFAVGGSERMRLTSNGNVGIGTNSPDNPLHIHQSAGGSTSYIKLTQDGTGEGATNGLLIGVNANEEAVFWNYENTEMKFATNNSEKMVILANGNVGIGTTSPGTILDIVTAVNKGIRVSDGTSTGILYPSGTLTNSVAVGSTTNVPLIFGTNNVFPQMVIQNGTGNVGIGETNPVAHLMISQTDGAAADVIRLRDVTDGADLVIRYMGGNHYGIYSEGAAAGHNFLTFKSDGNVGIGTTTPDQKLTVNGAINASGGIDSNGDGIVLKTKVIEIGDWNMNPSVDGSVTKNVLHGIVDGKKIRTIQVLIRSDPDDYYNYFFDGGANADRGIYSIQIKSTPGFEYIALGLVVGGLYDSSYYNAISYNRGWVTITYEA